MSVLPYPGFLYVSSICELASSDVSDLNTGCLAYVETEDAYFRLAYVPSPGTPAVPNGVDVVSVPGGPQTPGCSPVSGSTADRRRWILTNIADAVGSSANALAWYVNADPAIGSDANIGTDPLFPVQTAREVGERWQRGAGYNTAGPVNVYIQSTYLLNTDTLLIKRPVVKPQASTPLGNPIVYHGTRSADIASALAIVAAIDINHAGNQICSVTFNGNPAALLGRYIIIGGSGPLAGYWAKVIGLDPHNPNSVLTTPFVKQTSTYDPTLLVANSAAIDLPGTNYRVLGDGCQIPDVVAMSIDAGAEVWFYDMLMISEPLAPNPFFQSLIESGNLRFFRSQSATGTPASLAAVDSSQILFSGSSSEGFILAVDSEQGVSFSASYAELTSASSIKTLRVQQDSVFSPLWSLITSEGESCLCQDAAVNGNALTPTLHVRGGSINLLGALYGRDNVSSVLKMDPWSRGAYQDKTKLTVADASNVAYSGVIDYVGLVTVSKTFTALDLPYVDIATASNSQAGLVQGVY